MSLEILLFTKGGANMTNLLCAYSAIMARMNHNLAMTLVGTRGESALFQKKIVLDACHRLYIT